MSKNLIKDNRGFTIIEVLIVLAIAGLIMVMVFVAVPNLQRNQRNSGRRNEAARILTAANNFVTATNGAMPAQNNLAHQQQIIRDGGPYQQYQMLLAPTGTDVNLQTAAVTASADLADGDLMVRNGATTFTTNLLNARDDQAVVIATNASCGTSPGQVVTATRSIAVVFTLEAASSNKPTLACVSN